jgi:hypothetical protein
MPLNWKGGVESEWPSEGVVTARISVVDERGHGGMKSKESYQCISVSYFKFSYCR